MKRIPYLCLIALLFVGCPSNNQPPTSTPGTPVIDPSPANITSPDGAENALLSIMDIVRKTENAVIAAPRPTPRDQQIYDQVRSAAAEARKQARVVLPLIQTWKALQTPASRQAWELAWAELIAKAFQVILARTGTGSAALDSAPYPAPVATPTSRMLIPTYTHSNRAELTGYIMETAR